jgi:hypothetical protein
MKLRFALAALLVAAATLPAHALGRLADVVLVDRASGRELAVHRHAGRAYVVGEPGHEYQVRVRNRRGVDLLAVVSVDGVNVLSGESAGTGQRGYVIGARGCVDIGGWRKSLASVAAFYFTTLADSYAARTERPSDVGVIGVALFERRPEPPRYPENIEQRGALEGKARADAAPQRAAAAAPPLGTGYGRDEDAPARVVAFERATREPVETIAIYYDSRRNLAARGIVADDEGARDPRPFPAAFVPPPPRG